MHDPRHTLRILVFQCLCLLDAQGDEALPLLGEFVDDSAEDGETAIRAEKLARTIWERREELDTRVAATAKRWAVARLQPVDRSIIRLGAYEILHEEEIPRGVTINEAVEIAKAFGGEESPGFVNGILDGLSGAEEQSVEPATDANDQD